MVTACQCDIGIGVAGIGEGANVLHNQDIEPINKTDFYSWDIIDNYTYTENFVTDNYNTTDATVLDNEWVISEDFTVSNCADSESFTVNHAQGTDSVSRKILKIGDSLTDPYVSIRRVRFNFDTDVYNAEFIGTQDPAPNSNEGYGGKTYNWHYSNVNSPFVFNGVFDFPQYLSANGLLLENEDWIIFQLGTNDIGLTGDCESKYIESKIGLDAMIANIHSYNQNIRIAISTVHNTATEDSAWINNYGNANGNEYFHNCAVSWNDWLISDYVDGLNNIWILPIHYALDSSSDYPVDVNGDQSNAVHPTNIGYDKIGDYITAFLKYHN